MINCTNNKYTLCFDENSGVLDSLISANHEFVGEKISVFEIALRDEAGEQMRVEVKDMTLTDCKSDEHSIYCAYKNDDIKAEITIDLDEEIKWNISVDVCDKYVVEWVNYPQIAVPNDLKDSDGNSKILWGFNEGTLVDDLAYREMICDYKEPQYPGEGLMGIYPGIVETQFMAYYNDNAGLYFGAHDTEDNLKGIDFYRYKEGIKLQFRHYTGIDFGESYKMVYPMVMKFFRGDWYDAAEIYRAWFEKERSNFLTPISQNAQLPTWYGESPVVITYPVRGLHDTDDMTPNKLFPYCNAMPHIKRLEEELESKIMVILMHWEGTAPWAPPYVWPPFGGEAEFKKFVDELHVRGDIIGVYCSGLGWTEQSNLVQEYNCKKEFDEKNLRDVMCLSPKQTLPYSKICTDQRVGYDMCPTQDFAVNVLKDEVKKMTSAGIDYIQLLDQNHGGTSYFCYSKKHGHPPVPGRWQVDAVKKLLAKVQENTGKVLFGCESAAAESYIPQLLFSDNRFMLAFNIGMGVPVYSYIFHRYVNNFMGNQVITQYILDHKRCPENLEARVAYSFMAGDMLTAVLEENGNITWNWGEMNLEELPDQDKIKTLIKNLNMWRREKGKKYLHTGMMLKPYAIDCGENLIYTMRGYEMHFDKIFTSAWKADDGCYGQFLINYNSEATECIVDLPENSCFTLCEDGISVKKINGGKQKIIVPELSAVMIEACEGELLQ